ncbi:MAG: hypothetical protein M0D57_06145 [Sphingobacteriales bacterium JAD_PAG50586_3]|nr:MAG: hypothetical protein M0D57_06145 [Sphingobacteriales bacterium JAD_PAG50586_3]
MENPTLIAYGLRKGYLIIAFFLLVLAISAIVYSYSALLTLPLCILPLGLIYAYTLKKVVLLINEDGIEYKSTRFIKWDKIWYYYFIVYSASDAPGKLVIKLKEGVDNNENELVLKLEYINKNKEQLESILEYYSSINSIIKADDVKNPRY